MASSPLAQSTRCKQDALAHALRRAFAVSQLQDGIVEGDNGGEPDTKWLPCLVMPQPSRTLSQPEQRVHMIHPLPEVRRVITAIDADGRSYISTDGPSPATLTHPDRPGYRNAHLWRTQGMPAPLGAPEDISQHKGVMPPELGTILRVVDMPPQPAGDIAERHRQQAAIFDSLYGDVKTQPGNTRHADMHITDSIDYAIVLSGEIYAVMDEGETLLKAGDVLVQRGTNHAWDNRSGQIGRLAFVLVDARGTRV